VRTATVGDGAATGSRITLMSPYGLVTESSQAPGLWHCPSRYHWLCSGRPTTPIGDGRRADRPPVAGGRSAMWQRAAAALVRDVDDPGDGSAVTARPNYAGDLDDLLDLRPVFRTRSFGYDRLQVDNYATWAESELITARRQIDQLLSRFGECSAELEISRRMLAEAPRGRVYPVSERVEEMMQLAADEATAITQSGAEEAEQLDADFLEYLANLEGDDDDWTLIAQADESKPEAGKDGESKPQKASKQADRPAVDER